jgi:hypothetical protein
MHEDLARAVVDAHVQTSRSEKGKGITMELECVLGRIAEAIVEHGTLTEARALQAMSDATHELCPGAATALVDWNGSEIARLRAFGVVHGVVLRVLTRGEQKWLLDQALGTADPVLLG